jgi:hypothetical protein
VAKLSHGRKRLLPNAEKLFPSFPRRGGCAINKMFPFLISADGVVSTFNEKGALRGSLITTITASLYRARASLPAARQRMLRSFLFIARPPLLEKEGYAFPPALVADYRWL